MRGRIGKCPRCGRVYEIKTLTIDRGMVSKSDMGTMVAKEEEYFCQICQNSLYAWRQMENWHEIDSKG